MRLFGWLTRRRQETAKALQPVTPGSGGWWSLIREPFAGAWQRNSEIRTDTVLAYSAVFRCISLVSLDVSKMRIRLVAQDSNGIWSEVENPAFSPVLRKPNRYQTRIQFFANWVESKLIHGNAYVLKERDARNVVTHLYVLDPHLVTVLVAPDGSVYYELKRDDLAGIPSGSITVPASEIIHDRWNTIHHPLVGLSPIHAAGLAAMQGLSIQNSSAKFFEREGRPSGVLTVPTDISIEKAEQLREHWNTAYSAGGVGVGKVAVLANGMKFEPTVVTGRDAQLIEQLKWSAETVCSVFGVPAHMAGIGQPPTYNNIESLNLQYYSQCLQTLIENIELCLDEGLGLGPGFGNRFGTEFDLTDLMRMDTATKHEAAQKAIMSGGMSPNEARKRYFDLPPVPGGETPYLQEQTWPLRHLASRPLPDRPITPPEDIEPESSPPPDEAEDKRLRLIKQATREFHRLADRERMNGKIIH